MSDQVTALLESAVEDLDIPVNGDVIATCLALSDRLNAKITCAVGAFDRADLWKDDGATSTTAWLRSHADRSQRDAASMSRTARRLNQLPVTAQAWTNGRLSAGQVQAIVANLNDATAGMFADNEADLVDTLVGLSVDDVASSMQQWATYAEDELKDPTDLEPDTPKRSLHLSKTLDGRRELSGSFDPETGAETETALRLAQTKDGEGEPSRTPAEKRADAWADIVRFFLNYQKTQPGGRHRPHLNVFVDLENITMAEDTDADWFPSNGARPHPGPTASTTSNSRQNGNRGGSLFAKGGWLTDGTHLSGEAVSRLACDAGLHRIVTSGHSSILDYGTTTRVVPVNLFNALVARDRHCRFPGCDRPSCWCEAHHLVHWEHGGPTALPNLVLLCSRHHHTLHNPGWHTKARPDGAVEITKPNGQTLTSQPPDKPPDLLTTAASRGSVHPSNYPSGQSGILWK